MRSDYLPSETFCCFCGLVIKERQIAGNIEGIITYNGVNCIEANPLDAYLCEEHLNMLVKNIKGGITAARRKTYELERHGGDEMGKQGTP